LPAAASDPWADLLRRTLARYAEPLLRAAAARLVKPRGQWPPEELIERVVAAAADPAVIDRRLQDLDPDARRLLALVGHSRQPCWALGNLVEMLLALGAADGLRPALSLLEAGLLYPLLEAEPGAPAPAAAGAAKVKSFEQWLASAGPAGLHVFAPPSVAARAVGEGLGLPDLSEDKETRRQGDKETEGLGSPTVSLSPFLLVSLSAAQEADGLEWPLRLAVFWQQVAAAPLRRTQQGGFFKRDADRIGQDPLLNGPPADRPAEVPDAGFLVAALAEGAGMLEETEGEWRAGPLPPSWDDGLTAALEALWRWLPRVRAWNPLDGWRGGDAPAGNPFPSAYLLALLLLARLPEGAWVAPAAVQEWLTLHHPYWANEDVRPSRLGPWVETFLLGVAYHLKLVQAARAGDAWRVRLSPTGRWLLGLGPAPDDPPAYRQTLLVQPNLEVIAYRQGLTPALIARLTRVARWKALGAACTLQLGPETVYRALESGQTFESIRGTLEQHGARAVPPAVLDALRTWANKRDRITVYPSATLLEFAAPDDLNEALARGVPGVRLSDRLAVVADESAVEFRHFRLTGTRDYGLPPERCVTAEADGVTLTVDAARSDLLLETELPRFAERLSRPGENGRRQYRLTPASLAAARAGGLSAAALEAWFRQRTGLPLTPAARLLLTGAEAAPARFERLLVLHVASEELADGLAQWPETRGLIAARLGPTALAVAEEHAAAVRERLRAAGVSVAPDG
jgi:hypothetical protein